MHVILYARLGRQRSDRRIPDALVAPVLEVRKVDGRFEVVVPEEKVKKYFREGWVERKFLEEMQ